MTAAAGFGEVWGETALLTQYKRLYQGIYQHERVEYFDYLRALAIIPVLLVHFRTQALPAPW